MAPRVAYLLKKFPRLSETFVLNEMLGQEALGAQLHVFSRRTPDDEPRHEQLARLRAPVENLPDSRGLDPWGVLFDRSLEPAQLLERVRRTHERYGALDIERLGPLLGEALWLLRRTRELGIEHVHAHFATDSALVAMLLHALGGPGYSLTAHAKDIYRSTVSPRRLSALVGDSRFTVTVCDANVRHLESLVDERAARRVRRLYNGIDVEAFGACAHGTREPRTLLSIGRLVEKKGFDTLLEAVALLAQRDAQVRLDVIGDGEDRARLVERSHGLGLHERVRWLGPLPQERVREHLARATVFALSCKVGDDGNRDALPTVLLEAQAAGVPCVSTPVGGIEEILDFGRAGVLTPIGDAAALAAALERLLQRSDERAQLAAAGRARARECFDLAQQAQVLFGWFQEAVALREGTCASPM